MQGWTGSGWNVLGLVYPVMNILGPYKQGVC